MQVSNKLVSSIVYTNASFSDSVGLDGGRFENGGTINKNIFSVSVAI